MRWRGKILHSSQDSMHRVPCRSFTIPPIVAFKASGRGNGRVSRTCRIWSWFFVVMDFLYELARFFNVLRVARFFVFFGLRVLQIMPCACHLTQPKGPNNPILPPPLRLLLLLPLLPLPLVPLLGRTSTNKEITTTKWRESKSKSRDLPSR